MVLTPVKTMPERLKKRKPIAERLTFEYQGQRKRMSEIAQDDPVFLIQKLVLSGFTGRTSAIRSELNRVGYDQERIMQEVIDHPEWGVDPGVLQQL